VITAASLRLFPIPEKSGCALMVVRDPAAAQGLLAVAGRHAGDAISAFELINGTGLDFLSETFPDLRQPFTDHPDWSVLIDIGMTGGADPDRILQDIFEEAARAVLVSDGLIAQNQAQRQSFWSVRETIPLANKAIGAIASHDISLPLGAIPDFINKGAQAIGKAGNFRINCFGHLGDGNLHYNVFPARGDEKPDDPNLGDDIRRMVHDLVAEFDGSFSAEHGIGRLKTAELERYGDPAKLTAMRAIKSALDPNAILNPGAVLG